MRPKTRRLADLAGSLTRPDQPHVAVEDMSPFRVKSKSAAAAKPVAKKVKRPTR